MPLSGIHGIDDIASGSSRIDDDEYRSIDDDGEDEDGSNKAKGAYYQIPYGFQSRGCYKHASKNCEIVGVTYNSRFHQFVFLDSRGITSWSYDSVYQTVTRHLNYPAYQFNVLRLIIYSRKYNVYFALSKEYALKVFNINFHEVVSVSAEMHSVLCMVFNPVRSELITGGTGGMKFWTFGEVSTDHRRVWDKDSRPMANYGLALRAAYPKMGGSWVKQVELDIGMQRLYCLSERNVVAYDMLGNQLFEIRDAHRGPVTGCVYSQSCNMLVTAGNDCDVNVWGRVGGKVHTFSSHTKVITTIMLHPEAEGMVITSSLDGMVKIFCLDTMEEIYSLPIFPEGIYWMDWVSPKFFFCCSNRQIEVYALNHVYQFWALSRCSMRSLSLESCQGKSSVLMAVGTDSSVRLLSRQGRSLTTVLPPPPISPLTQVLDIAYNRELSMMYLLIEEQEIWVYYTRTNPSTRLEAWQLDYIEDIHATPSPEHSIRSRGSAPWVAPVATTNDPLRRTLNSRQSVPEPPSPCATPWEGSVYRESQPVHERLALTCIGMLCSPVIIHTLEGEACPDATNFLMAGTKDGRVLFLSMFLKGMKYGQLQVHKDLIISVSHDQVTNTLVSKCRSLNGVDVQFWSLPHLVPQKQITCDEDITCHVRMGDLMLSGHTSGFLRVHRLSAHACDVCEQLDEEKTPGGKRVPRDHQGPIISVDANRSLGIFCSSSTDGFVKLWDQQKMLLREIALDDTLTAVCFLNLKGDIIIGLKQQLFFISHEKACPVKKKREEALLFGQDHGADEGNEEFETESDIYEDPSVRYEGKKILQPDPTNMENYLVPFPNLHLKAALLMEGRNPPDLEQQNKEEDLETLSTISDSLSLAPTDIYMSPGTTPRRLSLASIPALERQLNRLEQEKQATALLWDLPYFGDSPVSSPPRTPPPEPTPPPTPPPESSEEEEEEEKSESKFGETEKPPACTECKDAVKGPKDRKAVNIPSFRREGGRLGNVRIDSKKLRGTGPGYAAPVVRDSYVPPEPKQVKARRAPRSVVKKSKKNKEKKEDEDAENADQQPGDASHPPGTDGTEGGQGRDEVRKAILDIPGEGGSDMKSRLQREVQEARRNAVKTDEEEGASGREGGEQEAGKGGLEGARGRQEGAKVGEGVDGSRWGVSEDETEEGTRDEDDGRDPLRQTVQSSVNTRSRGEDPDDAQADQSGDEYHSTRRATKRDGTTHAHGKHGTEAGGDSARDYDPGFTRVVYVDPESGQTVEGYYNEMPKDAEVLHIADDGAAGDDDGDYGDYEDEGPEGLTNSRQGGKRQKSVTFSEHKNIRRIPRASRGSITQARGPDFARNQRRGSGQGRSSVVPIDDPQLQADLITGESSSSRDMSPLTIFALARSRKQNARKSPQRGARPPEGTGYVMYAVSETTPDGRTLFIDSPEDDRDLSDREAPQIDVHTQPRVSASPTERPRSSTRTQPDMVTWCLQALKKSHRQIMFPPKPRRPGSSPSIRSVASACSKKEGETLVINMREHRTLRPQTADTVRTTDSKEEFAMYPYHGVAQTRDEPTSLPVSRDQLKRDVRAKTAPAGRRPSRDSDVDLEEAYREMHASMDAIGKSDNSREMIYRSHSAGVRAVSSHDFPSLEVEDYSGNWQDIVLHRARLLKQQRLERQKSAKERRDTIDNQQKERRKKAGHIECAQDTLNNSEKTIEFITPSTSPHPPFPGAPDVVSRELREQELSSERAFRLRLRPRSSVGTLSPVARSIIDLRSSEHDVADLSNVMPRSATASIPAKCSRYVLITEKPGKKGPRASPLEQSLLMARFPNQPPPRMRKGRMNRLRSTANIRLENEC
ncbi:uncharacterized protein LOC5517160 isoform X2 [Nematostella vectensis]|uniref:uncharacterized protein LOC5517160 isoform X2 n=1 Tax=Nematostella vectensis TaxID=45351 RepID=UPI002076F160|nr:uncharacterized protein LOC5517160 isoform X2 [Nematostella vectensis]